LTMLQHNISLRRANGDAVRPGGMELLAICGRARALCGSWTRTTVLVGAAVIATMAVASSALAQDAASPAIAPDSLVTSSTLPRDLSAWGMYMSADPVVKAVLIGLAFASVVTWTVWLAKTIEIVVAKRRVAAALKVLASVRSVSEGVEQLADTTGEIRQFLDAAVAELKLSTGSIDTEGIKERIASRLDRIEASYGRRILRGAGARHHRAPGHSAADGGGCGCAHAGSAHSGEFKCGADLENADRGAARAQQALSGKRAGSSRATSIGRVTSSRAACCVPQARTRSIRRRSRCCVAPSLSRRRRGNCRASMWI
jgi:hypothetical protein